MFCCQCALTYCPSNSIFNGENKMNISTLVLQIKNRFEMGQWSHGGPAGLLWRHGLGLICILMFISAHKYTNCIFQFTAFVPFWKKKSTWCAVWLCSPSLMAPLKSIMFKFKPLLTNDWKRLQPPDNNNTKEKQVSHLKALPTSIWVGPLCRQQVTCTTNGHSSGCMSTPAACAQVGW